jgi:hypothetical protein
MSEAPKVKGPASYFPSIEKTYGKPIPHWMEVLRQAGELKHMELVSLLKTKHKRGPRARECLGGPLSRQEVGVEVQEGMLVQSNPATPNPSIEGMPKRLRLLCTPHVKR